MLRALALIALAAWAAAEDTVVTIGEATAQELSPALLGTHMGYTFRGADWEASARRRFPACGWSDGALVRHFVANSGPRTIKRGGREVTIPARDWWGHIQADERARGDGEDADYRWMQVDIWQDLDYVEQLHGDNLIVASGFPELSKETAAALVAFCNGSPDDQRVIGVDRLGTDWKTVGHWASIRAHGDARHPAHPAPYGVRWWEIGNELYDPRGGQPDSWLRIADFSDRDPTRNNAARAGYFLDGRTVGGVAHEGWLDFAAAMKRIDPKISVGAMLAPEHKWQGHGDWNSVILERAKGQLDFASFHPYQRCKGMPPEKALDQPREDTAVFVDALRKRLRGEGYADGFPLIASEWSAYEPSDIELIRMPTALIVADTLGVFASRGIAGECFYSAYDTIRPDGSWAVMVRTAEAARAKLPAGHRWPTYYAFALWHRLDGRLAEARVDGERSASLDAWASRSADGARAAVLLVNRSASPAPVRIRADGRFASYRIDTVAPADGRLEDGDVLYDGVAMSSPEGEAVDDLERLPPTAAGAPRDGAIMGEVPAWGMLLAGFSADSARVTPSRR
jgi:hypothetical protein